MLRYAVMAESKVKQYELMVIFRPRILQKGAESLVKKMIKEVDGKVGEVDFWGEREMKYEIDNEERGLYILFYIQIAKDCVSELRKVLNMEPDILRILIV